MGETIVYRAEPRPVVYMDMRKRDPIYTAKPATSDFQAALTYLSLIFPNDVAAALVAKLKAGKVVQARANDILRAAKVPPLDEKDPGVQKEIGQIKDEQPQSPVLLIQGDLYRGLHLIIADGMHRTTAAFLRDPDAMVSAVIAQVDWSALDGTSSARSASK